jgi:outer membrane murein-binding lipoprotein Lpp
MSEGENGGTLRYRVQQLEASVTNLTAKVDRLMFSVVALSLTIAGAAITFALTYQGSK